jgi:hypothetical protein
MDVFLQALADLGEFVPTVFIGDLSMPGLDGAYYEDFAAAPRWKRDSTRT